MKIQFIVTCSISKHLTRKALKDYIDDACNSQSGCYHPEDPLFCKQDFTVRYFPLPTKRKSNKQNKHKQKQNKITYGNHNK